MKMKSNELEGLALDWAVAQIDPMCNGLELELVAGGRAWAGFGNINGKKTACLYLAHGSCLSERMRMRRDGVEPYYPSTDWSQGGRLVDEHIAALYEDIHGCMAVPKAAYSVEVSGPTKLIAACRAIVVGKLGDEVELPDELVSA